MGSDLATNKCIQEVDEWIINHKNVIYDETIKDSEGSNNDLVKYTSTLEGLSYRLVRAIEQENTEVLKSLGWPQSLMECISDPSYNLIIIDRIELWFVRHPFAKSKYQIQQLAKENIGLG